MGCDIYLVQQVKNTEGEWEHIPCVWQGAPFFEWDWMESEKKEKSELHFRGYGDRNYSAYSILADVRNGDGFEPIEKPRGLPKDFSKQMEEYIRTWAGGPDEDSSYRWEVGDHSHSWFTLKELLDFDWRKVGMCRGVISFEEWQTWDKISAPNEYSKGIWGPGIYLVPLQYRRAFLDAYNTGRLHEFALSKGNELASCHSPTKDVVRWYLWVEWAVTYAQASGRFMDYLKWLKEYAHDNKIETQSVRIVFGFAD